MRLSELRIRNKAVGKNKFDIVPVHLHVCPEKIKVGNSVCGFYKFG